MAKDQIRPYQFFLISAQTDIIPNAKNNIASIQLLLRNASINAIPKNNMKTARFVNFITLIFLFFLLMTCGMSSVIAVHYFFAFLCSVFQLFCLIIPLLFLAWPQCTKYPTFHIVIKHLSCEKLPLVVYCHDIKDR